MEDDEKDRIKNSFIKVRQDIDSLKSQINELKSQIELLVKKIGSSQENNIVYKLSPQGPKETSSTGNDGVYSDIHSFIHSDIHSFNRHSTDIQQANATKSKSTQQNIYENHIFAQNEHEKPEISWSLSNIKQIDSLFLSLTKQEFLCFLTIYQLEEDLKRGISYLELSQHMSLSEGCMRTYVSQMLKKAIPIQKIRVNNKITLLTINKEFRVLNLKHRLISLLSKSDLNQTTLL